jgi:hypothetical protein
MALVFVLRWLGWAALAWSLFAVGDSVQRDYAERARLQAEHLWLYKHCLDNGAQLKAHTDACDRVALVFAESPLEGAVLHPAMTALRQGWQRTVDWHASACAYVSEHRYLFGGLWLVLFLTLPRVCLQAFCPPTREQARLRAAAAISLGSARLRRRCIV